MVAHAAARVLDRACRGESLALAAAGESVPLGPAPELDACYDGKPVCMVRPLALLAGVPVFAESSAPEPILAARRDSLARALNRPVAFLGSARWSVVTP